MTTPLRNVQPEPALIETGSEHVQSGRETRTDPAFGAIQPTFDRNLEPILDFFD